jgi:hypothetical protein
MSIGGGKRGRTSVCNGKACAISNHNIVRSLIWGMKGEVVEIRGNMMRSTVI